MPKQPPQTDPAHDMLINGVGEIADSLAGAAAETPSVADMMANPAGALAAAAVNSVAEELVDTKTHDSATADRGILKPPTMQTHRKTARKRRSKRNNPAWGLGGVTS